MWVGQCRVDRVDKRPEFRWFCFDIDPHGELALAVAGGTDNRRRDISKVRDIRNLIIASLTIFLSSSALSWADSDGFTRNYGEWKALSKGMKWTYIAGAFDMLMNSEGQRSALRKQRNGGRICALIAGVLAERVLKTPLGSASRVPKPA